MDNLNCTDEGNEQEMALYNSASWWLECVAELSIGVMGLLGNGVAIFLLRSDRLASTFNRLLIGLCVVDNLFILSCCLEAVRRFVGTSNFHELAFIYFLYQLQSISLSCSINMTVVLAIERYIAVTRPVEYHMATVSSGPGKRVALYMVPTVVFSVLFNIPKFFELEANWHAVEDIERGRNITVVHFETTSLRKDPNYSFYYVHLTQLIVKGILPFGALVFLNLGIYRAIKKRHATQLAQRSLGNHRGTATTPARVGNNDSSGGSNGVLNQAQEESYKEERRCAAVLFTIVILFFVSHAPRILLNFYEFFAIEEFKDPCYHIPLWAMILTCVSLLFMTINSSVNFFVYCFANSLFRQEILQRWSKIKDFCSFGSNNDQSNHQLPENTIQLQVLLPKGDMHRAEEIGGHRRRRASKAEA